jgi:hypothetical protein
VLVVDAANVVGSRPTGWWRDRAGAAAALHHDLTSADLDHDVVVLVLEGQARRGHPADEEGRLRTVHAPGAGDDTIVDQLRQLRAAGHEVTVVTADRGLRERVAGEGGTYVGPSWLLARVSR